MKIVLVNHQNPYDVNVFSGLPYFMSRAIKVEFEEVVEYNDFEPTPTMVTDVLKGDLQNSLIPQGKKLSEYLKRNCIEADFVLCQGGNSCVPFYEHTIPLVYWHDSTWCTYLHGNVNDTAFSAFKHQYKFLYLWDKMALDRAKLVVLSSDYVAESCVRNYGIPRHKIEVIPFGANIPSSFSNDQLNESLKEKLNSSVLNLTFIGKDWQRKGLPKAYELTEKLNLLNIPTQLNVIGAYPPGIKNLPYLNLLGFLDKSDENQFNAYQSILTKTHFLIHPAIAEPFGIALCEANSFGVPIIGTNVGGLKTIVHQGKNGFLFENENFVSDAIDKITVLRLNFRENYVRLFNATLNEFNQRLNWETNTKRLKKILLDANF